MNVHIMHATMIITMVITIVMLTYDLHCIIIVLYSSPIQSSAMLPIFLRLLPHDLGSSGSSLFLALAKNFGVDQKRNYCFTKIFCKLA